jgi:UDPglucose 6-dehydrogenase
VTQPIIGFVGMTHLGLVSGISATEKGFRVICFDQDADKVRALNEGILSVSEPHLDELIIKNKSQISFTDEVANLKKCDVLYVAPDIATDDFGKSNLAPIDFLLNLTYDAARDDAVIVVLSQVPPGFSRARVRHGKTLYYQVETLIFGRAVERALYPERYIVGCANPAKELPEPYKKILEAYNCPILKMRYESAELAKISINMCLVASVSTANILAEICENIGADWSEIIPALKLDKRIGQYSYLNPGLGISGGNLERDLATVCRLGDEHGTDTNTVRAWNENSYYRKNWPFRTLYREVLSKINNPVIAILGLAYKENTHSVKNSPAILLLESLKPYKTRLYDPVVSIDMVAEVKSYFAKDSLDACEGADVLIIMTPWDEFRNLNISDVANALSGKIVIDPYKVFNQGACLAKNIDYHTLGVKH